MLFFSFLLFLFTYSNRLQKLAAQLLSCTSFKVLGHKFKAINLKKIFIFKVSYFIKSISQYIGKLFRSDSSGLDCLPRQSYN